MRKDLEAKGFKIVFDREKPREIRATLRRGEGASATWLTVEVSNPFNLGLLEAVQVASNPFTIAIPPPSAEPESVGDKENFPFLPPPPAARLTTTEHYNHAMTFYTGEKGDAVIPIGTGFVTKDYKPDPTLSSRAFHDAYAAALTKAGWTVTSGAHTGFDVNAHFDRNGRDLYVRLTTDRFHVADVGRELAASLQKNCKAAVYGINFDFDKATLRSDSDATLNQVLALLKQQPKLSVEIGGHTDNVGKPDYNLSLSGRRAAAVKDWLVAHGIAGARLTSRGYGDTQPLVPNSSEENRAMNRRVELKKPNC